VTLTLVPLLLDLELLGEILVLLPLDGGSKSTIIDEVARITNFFLVKVCLL